jgi:hypothetical protein
MQRFIYGSKGIVEPLLLFTPTALMPPGAAIKTVSKRCPEPHCVHRTPAVISINAEEN